MQIAFQGQIVIVGGGAIGCAVIPLLLRHLRGADGEPPRIDIITADERGGAVARQHGLGFTVQPLTRDNYVGVLEPRLRAGDLLLNLSVDVSSIDLVRLCHRLDALYVDTCIEPWAGGYYDAEVPIAERTNYALRRQALALRDELGAGPTAVLAHGANPGLISHFAKQALLDAAAAAGLDAPVPDGRASWAALAQRLGVAVVHCAEHDSQRGTTPKAIGEFVNTWSVDGFISEGLQPAELGWGTHERALPADAHTHADADAPAIFLLRPGAGTRVRTWTPKAGPIAGHLITHNEAISLADYLTVRDAAGRAVYRPTVHYAYHPCSDAILSLHELAGRGWQAQPRQRILLDEALPDGHDELGALLMYGEDRVYWYGTTLDVAAARRLAPHNNATSLQVAAGVLGAVVWAITQPRAGLVEAEDMDHAQVLATARPYLGELAGFHGRWNPLTDRYHGMPRPAGESDAPWQLAHFLLP